MAKSTYTRKIIKWSVGEAPSGPYRSLHHRSWPTAHDQYGNSAVMLRCKASYNARVARDTGDDDIIVYIADWSNANAAVPDPNKATFDWIKLDPPHKNVKCAKAAAEMYLNLRPELMKAVDQSTDKG